MTWEVNDSEGNRWRLHMDRWDSEFVWLYRKGPGDQSKWLHALTLELVPDD